MSDSEDDLLPLGNDGDNSVKRTSKRRARNRSGDSDDGGTVATDDGNGTIDDLGSAEVGGNSRKTRSKSKRNSINDFVAGRRNRAPKESARSDSGRSGSNSGSGNAGNETETTAGNASQDSPRSVKFDSLGDSTKVSGDTSFISQFVAEAWGLGFQGLSFFFRDPEWRLAEEDALELSSRTVRLIDSLDKKKAAALKKKLAKFGPGTMLLTGLIGVLQPRIAHTMELKRARRVQKVEEKPDQADRTAAASVSNPSARVVGRIDAERGNAQPIRGSESPFRREDFARIYGQDES